MTKVELTGVTASRAQGARRVSVVRNLSLRLDHREILLLEGPSGSGKTTLLGVMAGLLTPDSGTVRVGDVVLGDLSPQQVRTWRAVSIGFVFQRSNLMPLLTARENVAYAATLAGLSGGTLDVAVDGILDELEIARLGDRLPNHLSGGEEQRFAVARALVHSPPMVLADEPTGSLDSAAGQRVSQALVTAAQARGASVVIATHDARLAQVASRRVAIEDGRLIGEGAER